MNVRITPVTERNVIQKYRENSSLMMVTASSTAVPVE